MTLQQRERQTALQAHAQSLHNLSPLQVLARGFSLTTDENHKPITNSKQVNIGDKVETRLNSGRIRAKIFERLDDDTI
jgi:exodeoxyribonuclease VII large subunit